jgi:hypothetical protein
LNADSKRSPSAAASRDDRAEHEDLGDRQERRAVVVQRDEHREDRTRGSRDEALPRLGRRDGRRELVPAHGATDQVRRGVADPDRDDHREA